MEGWSVDFAICTQADHCLGLYIMGSGWLYVRDKFALAKLKKYLPLDKQVTCPKCRQPTLPAEASTAA